MTDGDEVSVELEGKYNLQITNDFLQLMMNGSDIEVDWHSDKKKRKRNNTLYCNDKELVKVLLNETRKKNITPGLGEEISTEGYTQATTTTKHENRVIFYAHPYFQGRKWYDWAYVHFKEITASGASVEKYYHSKILVFLNEWITRSTFRLGGQFTFSIIYIHTESYTTFYVGT